MSKKVEEELSRDLSAIVESQVLENAAGKKIFVNGLYKGCYGFMAFIPQNYDGLVERIKNFIGDDKENLT